MLKSTQFQVEPSTTTRKWGYLHVPDDKTKKYPIIWHGHGNGEIGITQESAKSLLKYGPQAFIKETANDSKTWNPQDWMVFCFQSHSWSPPISWIQYALENDPQIKANWNGDAYITGLSAGGQEVIAHARKYGINNTGKYCYTAMSPAGSGTGLQDGKIDFWNFCGTKDTVTGGALALVRALKAKYGGELTEYEGGHHGWNTYFNPAFKQNGKSIYDWAKEKLGGSVVEPPVPEKKIINKVMFTTYDDGSFDATKAVI